MESIKPASSSNLGGKIRSFGKALRFRAAGVAPDDKYSSKVKVHEKSEKSEDGRLGVFRDDEELQSRMAEEALLAKVFARLSSVKAAYAQMQIAQSPYDAEGIHCADEMLVGELKRLSELKQCYLKKEFGPVSEETWLLAEREEQQNLLKTYVIVGKQIEAQVKRRDYEIGRLREKVEKCQEENRLLEKRLSWSLSYSVFDELHFSGLNPNHFITALKLAVKSVRSFVKLMVDGMESAGWDIEAAARSIDPDIVYTKTSHTCFGFESFVCREMFEGFHHPDFSHQGSSFPPGKTKPRQHHFFTQFMKLKSIKTKALIIHSSPFGQFCRAKYLQLVHPKMEQSLYGNLNQRNSVNSGGYPNSTFFDAFSEMARRVWLLHCLAFSFTHEASIFQVKKGSRFSEVYMESVTDDPFLSVGYPQVSLTVVPGFVISKTVVQARVYLCAT